jgi:peptidyl-prolyl cis-trans isomerase A (cyclophilin A)
MGGPRLTNLWLPITLLATSVLLVTVRCCEIIGNTPNPFPSADAQSPPTYAVRLETNLANNPEPVVIFVNRSWSPLGADRLFSLVQDGYYNQAAFFRVVPDFVVQFGIAAKPSETTKWNTNIHDDPVLVSNVARTVTYATAGPDTRTAQLFINYIDNSRLDEMGFSPFGIVVSGFDTTLNIYNPTPNDSNGIDQDMYTAKGNDWLLDNYPGTTLITCASLVDSKTYNVWTPPLSSVSKK